MPYGAGWSLTTLGWEVFVWWALIAVSFPISYYVFRRKVMSTRAAYRKVRLYTVYLLGSFISYVLWVLTFQPGERLADLTPFGGFLLAVLFPWILGLRKKS